MKKIILLAIVPLLIHCGVVYSEEQKEETRRGTTSFEEGQGEDWKWVWTAELPESVSETHCFQILKMSRPASEQNGSVSVAEPMQVLVDSDEIQKKKGDEVKFKFRISSKEPVKVFRDQFMLGQGFGFSRLGEFPMGISAWIYMQGDKLVQAIPSHEDDFIGSDLKLVTFETSDQEGHYLHDVVLRKIQK